MGTHYGQQIIWSTPSAPHPFSGICTSYSYAMRFQEQLDDDEVGDHRALILHSRKADVSFSAKVVAGSGGTGSSTDFLNLTDSGVVTLSTAVPNAGATGIVLATRCMERWQLGQPKSISLQAVHFPDVIDPDATVARTVSAGADGPSSFAGVIAPGGRIIYGTAGLGAIFGESTAVGIVHMLEIIQERQITEAEVDPAGVILGASSHGYLRRFNLELLATAAAPAENATIAISGTASGMAANYKITSVEQRFADKRGKMYAVSGVWIPPLG